MYQDKPTSIPYHRKQHEAQQHNVAPRLKGVVKNRESGQYRYAETY